MVLFSARLVDKYFPGFFKESDSILSLDHPFIFRILISPACAPMVGSRLIHYLIKYKLLRAGEE